MSWQKSAIHRQKGRWGMPAPARSPGRYRSANQLIAFGKAVATGADIGVPHCTIRSDDTGIITYFDFNTLTRGAAITRPYPNRGHVFVNPPIATPATFLPRARFACPRNRSIRADNSAVFTKPKTCVDRMAVIVAIAPSLARTGKPETSASRRIPLRNHRFPKGHAGVAQW